MGMVSQRDKVFSWSPQSDLRNCGVPAVEKVIRIHQEGLNDDGSPKSWLAAYLDKRGVTVGEVSRAFSTLADGLKTAYDDPTTDLDAALSRSGFHDCPFGAKDYVAAMIGRQFVGQTVWTLHEATYDDHDEARIKADIVRACDAGAEFLKATTGAPRGERLPGIRGVVGRLARRLHIVRPRD